MTKLRKTIHVHKKLMAQALITASIILGTPLAIAQEETGERNGALVPNLTVNIKLNSALGEKETEFYSKIAQDLISKLPHQLNLGKQAEGIKDLDEAYRHLNVVTYLPATDDVDTDKLIKHFKVRFVFDDEDGAKTAEEAQDIVLPKSLQEEKVDESTVGLKKPQEPEEEAPKADENTSMIDRMVAAEPAPVVPVPPAPQSEPVAAAPKPAPVVVAAVTPKPTPVAKAAPAPKTKVDRLRLAFDTDETNLSVPQRVETMKFIQKLRSNYTKQPDGFVFVVRSYEGPIGVEDKLGESRLRSVTALLRQQDINVSRSRVTEIFVRTEGQQFVEVEPVY